jgi:serine/threonine-protein kinase RsbW
MKNINTEHFIIENRIEEIPVLAEKIERLAEEEKLSYEMTMNINLVLEEALSNIIYYAFSDNKKHLINILLSLEDKKLTIKITDDGIPFDPTLHKEPDISLPVEEREIGGLGILLISKIMDTVKYSRDKNLNILTLTKYLK